MLLDLLTTHAGLVQGLTLWTVAGLTYTHCKRKAPR